MATFSLAALTALELSAPELIEVAAAAGYDQVGLRLLPATPGGVCHPLLSDSAMMRMTRERLAATGIGVADLEVVAFRPETDVAALEAFLAAGRELGAKHTLVAAYDPDQPRFVERFAAYCEMAARYGLTADLEFMPWTAVPDLTSAAGLLRSITSPAAGLLVDALHFDRSGSRVKELAAVPQRRLHYWQICDGPRERPQTLEALIHAAREERLFPGEGELDLVTLARAMPDHAIISVEVPTAALARTTDALTRARRALRGAKAVLAAAGRGPATPS